MKRYPPYDPPEYVNWEPDAEVMEAYRARFEEPALRESLELLGPEGIGELYRGLVRFRMHDTTLKRWVRTGVLTKAWLGAGEEATTVGAVHALGEDDVVGPMIRNAAACFERGIAVEECFKAYLATGDTEMKGRDLHIGSLRHGVISPISHVGDLVPVLAGLALAFRLREEPRVALTWCGEGATRTGAFHEGLSMAAGLSLPLIVVVQDNLVALGTRRGEVLADALKGIPGGYGVHGLECDGNHVVDVHQTIRNARECCLSGDGPVVVYSRTFRMGGHATHDEAEARALFPPEVFAEWGQRDPIGCFEEFLKGPASPLGPGASRQLGEWEEEVTESVEAAAEAALRCRDQQPPDPQLMAGDVVAGPTSGL